LNQYNKLTGDFDAFYIGKQNPDTNVYYQKLMRALGDYSSDVKNKHNLDALNRLAGVTDFKQVVTKDMRVSKNTKTDNLGLTYMVYDNLKMMTDLSIQDIPQKIVFYMMVSGNLF
jgi:hypothetical protein